MSMSRWVLARFLLVYEPLKSWQHTRMKKGQ